MTRTSRIFLAGTCVGASLAASTCSSLLAQPGQPPRRMVLQALDLNGDGSLQPNEIEAASTSLLTLDRNHDGQLTPDEYMPQDRERQGATGAPSELRTRLMAMDRNGDGVLTIDEVPERMQPLFQRADANHDGKVTPAEIDALAAAQNAPQGRPAGKGRAEGMARFDLILNAIDVDHDGILSAAEIASASGALKTLDTNADGTLQPNEIRMRQQTPAERTAHMLDEWDTNKDGVLTKAECPDRMQQQFEAIDTNHDGKLSAEELTTYFATMPQGGPRGGAMPRNDAPNAQQLPPASGQAVQPAQPH